MAPPPIEIQSLDHLVLTVRDVDASCDFYERVLGMSRVTFGDGRLALKFGRQKINLHHYPSPRALVADTPLPGTGDLCFITETPIPEVEAHLEACGVDIISGPIERSGAEGPILSLYCRDPDGNLIELSNRLG
ncbi:MAG: VOC family protein [Kiloniellales bacterium]|jgi:catechol 2,3-dioxygenase-like lactoylglutathione lyase family enzyme